MSDFEVRVYPAEIQPHPNADAIELCHIGGYRSIVMKDSIRTGEPVAYIPEAAVLPPWLIAELGLEGKLAGSGKNRVKPIRLRGIYSEGLVYPMPDAAIGADVTEQLGIVKYEPPIPAGFRGELEPRAGQTIRFDIENIKRYPDTLREGEAVVVTEKLHGTWWCAGYYREEPLVVASKGNSGNGMAFKINDANARNPYVRQALRCVDTLDRLHREYASVYILGEIYGLHRGYRYDAGQDWPMRVFDIYLGEPRRGEYASWGQMVELLAGELPTVPLLYQGPYDEQRIRELASGASTLNGEHIREGVIVKADPPRDDLQAGRVIFKVINEAYALKSDGEAIQ